MGSEVLENPLVSLIVPTYNTGRYIIEAIESIMQQTYAPIELIVVNDGSTDNTSELLASYAEQFPGKFKYFTQANAGQSMALNFGWKQSSGELLGYLSADDRLHPTAIHSLVQALSNRPDVVATYPDFCVIDENSQFIRSVTTKEYDQHTLIADFQCLPGPGALFRRSAWLATGDWSSELRQIPDMDFFLRLSIQGSFLRVPQTLADFRMHSGSTTYSPSSPEKADEPLNVVDNFFKQANLSTKLLGWQKHSRANALMLSGFIHGYSGRYLTFIRRMARAALISPSSVITKKMAGYIVRILKNQFGM